jgi:hypothetical protein
MKFFNACGDVKVALDLCFREEKKLRKKLNPRVSSSLPSPLVRGGGSSSSSNNNGEA